jgi:hypothetical protein
LSGGSGLRASGDLEDLPKGAPLAGDAVIGRDELVEASLAVIDEDGIEIGAGLPDSADFQKEARSGGLAAKVRLRPASNRSEDPMTPGSAPGLVFSGGANAPENPRSGGFGGEGGRDIFPGTGCAMGLGDPLAK